MAETRLKRQDYLPDDSSFLAEPRRVEPFPLHAHDYYEMEIILSGTGTQTINGREVPLHRGVVYLLSPGDFHEILSADNVRLYNLAFDESFLSAEELLELFGTFPFCGEVGEERWSRLIGAAELLTQERERSLGRPLVEYLFRLCTDGTAAPLPLTPVRRAMLYVQSHFREDPSLAEAARIACLSPVYFGNRFRAETGMTYVEYLNTCKLSCAKMLLRSGLSVTEACFRAGFGSLSGFLYTFKRAEGMSPAAYRRHVTESEEMDRVYGRNGDHTVP